jgi:hypothetical protein
LLNVTVSTGVGGTQDGNITVAAAITWAANTTLTLDAANDFLINAPITATGATAGLALDFGGTYTLAPGVAVTLSGAGSTFSVNGQAYTLIRDVDELQVMQSGLSGRHALAVNIDATATAGRNGPLGFSPAGNDVTRFTGTFDGLGHTIAGLTINRPGTDYVGLFGAPVRQAASGTSASLAAL